MRKEIAEMTPLEIRKGFANGQLTDCDECGATMFINEDCPNECPGNDDSQCECGRPTHLCS